MSRLRRALLGCSLLIGLSSAPSLARADDFKFGSCVQPNPSNSLQADLGSAVIGVGYERRLVPELSLRLTLQYNKPWYTETWGYDDTDSHGYMAELRPFVFPQGTGLKGLYVSPFARVGVIHGTDGLREEDNRAAWSAGATVGYGWMFDYERILLRVGAGAQYWSWKLEDQSGTGGMKGFMPQVDIILGWAF